MFGKNPWDSFDPFEFMHRTFDTKDRCNPCAGKGNVTLDGKPQQCAMCRGSGSVAWLRETEKAKD